MVRIATGNLLTGLPDAVTAEQFDPLVTLSGIRVERIISSGQVTPEGEWYDQQQHEWVALLQGGAQLQLEHEPAPRTMAAGDWIMLPAGCRHRVVWTDPDRETVWLAVHWPIGDVQEE